MYYHMHIDGSDASVADFRRSIAGKNSFFDFNTIVDMESKITPEHKKWFYEEMLSDQYADAYNHVDFDREKAESQIAWGVDSNVEYCAEAGLHDIYFIFKGKKGLTPEFAEKIEEKADKYGVKIALENKSHDYSKYGSYSLWEDLEYYKKDMEKLKANDLLDKASYFNADLYNQPYIKLSKDEAAHFGVYEKNACLFSDGFVCSVPQLNEDTWEALCNINESFKEKYSLSLTAVKYKFEDAPVGKRFVIANLHEGIFEPVSGTVIYEAGIGHGGTHLLSKMKKEQLITSGSYMDMFLVQKGSPKIFRSPDSAREVYNGIEQAVRTDFYQCDRGTVISGDLISRTNGYDTERRFYDEHKGDGMMYVVIKPGIHGESYEMDTNDGVMYEPQRIVPNQKVLEMICYSDDYNLDIKSAVSEKTMKDINNAMVSNSKISVKDFETVKLPTRQEIFKKHIKYTPVRIYVSQAEHKEYTKKR